MNIISNNINWTSCLTTSIEHHVWQHKLNIICLTTRIKHHVWQHELNVMSDNTKLNIMSDNINWTSFVWQHQLNFMSDNTNWTLCLTTSIFVFMLTNKLFLTFYPKKWGGGVQKHRKRYCLSWSTCTNNFIDVSKYLQLWGPVHHENGSPVKITLVNWFPLEIKKTCVEPAENLFNV